MERTEEEKARLIAEYSARRNARITRLEHAADRASAEATSRLNRAESMASVIPLGQPILVGHYSEGRDRNYRAKIDNNFRKGYEAQELAADLHSRAESAANNTAIFSDDPEAPDKISDKIAKLEAEQEQYKAINATYTKYLKNPASLELSDLPEFYKKMIREFTPDWHGDKPIPAYRLTNNGANIRRLKERAALVEKKQALHDEDFEINGVRVEGRPSENRIRLFYPRRVPREAFDLLRQHGFRVLRSEGEGAFSAYYNNNALYFVKTYIKEPKQ